MNETKRPFWSQGAIAVCLVAGIAWAAQAKAPPLRSASTSSRSTAKLDGRAGHGGSSIPTTIVEAPLAAEYNPSLLDSTMEQNALISSLIRTEVENDIKASRGRMSIDPAGIKQSLKLTLERVIKAPELSAELRSQLRSQLEVALRESDRRAIEKETRALEFEQSRAAAEERLRVVQSLERDQEKVKQLMDRFNSLMSEGRYLLAEEAAAAEVNETAPDLTEGIAAVLDARTVRYTQQALVTRITRQKAVVDTLAQCEIAFIPFPDDQPIVYPDASFWEDLTLRRKKWKDFASADIKDQKGAAARIKKALEDPTNIEFVEAPLQDVVDYLKDLHGIEIQLDSKALEDASIGPDTPVTRNLKGITLRSALRLVLGAMDLTYVIKNEVLLITTPEKAGNELVTKVYPVADLVLPIRQTGFTGGFGGLGGGGGGLGGIGGGGGGGGGLGGGGGGFF